MKPHYLPILLVLLVALAVPLCASQVASFPSPYGYDSGSGIMTAYDGLQYQFRTDGTIKVMRGSETLSFVGLGVNGRVGTTWITKYVTDFTWTWQHQTDGQGNHYFNATVSQTNYDWYANVSFPKNPALPMKINYGFKNKMAQDITNIRLFYLQTAADGTLLRYGGQNYTLSWGTQTHLTNGTVNLTAIAPKVDFPSFWAFNYSDLISHGFTITDFYAGNASKFDALLPNQLVVGIAMTKGNGVLPAGATEWADPTIVQTTSQATASAYAQQRKVIYDAPCSAVFAAYLNGSQAFLSVSLDNGTTWTAYNISKGGTTDTSLSLARIPQTRDIFVAYAKSPASAANTLYFVNVSKNAGCTWTVGSPFNATDAVVGDAYGNENSHALTACPDGSLHLAFSATIAGTTAGFGHKVCRAGAGSNCSIAANWNASNNTAGFDIPEYDTFVSKSIFCDKNSNAYSIAFRANAPNDMVMAKYAKTGAGVWTKEYIASVGAGSGYDETWSATTNSSGAIFLTRGNEQLAGDARRAQYRYCDGGLNCSAAASWTDFAGFAAWRAIIPAFSAVSNVTTHPSISIINDLPQIAVETRIYSTNYDAIILQPNSSGTGWNMTANYSRDALGNRYPQAPENATIMMAIWVNGTPPYSLVFNATVAVAGGGTAVNQTSETYYAANYETNSSFFNTTLDYDSAILTFANATLAYNGTEYATTPSDNGSTVYFDRTHTLPFLSGALANNTALGFYWSAHFTYANASEYVWNSTSRTQSLWYAWFWNAWAVVPTNLLAGQQALATMNGTNVTGYPGAISIALIDWAGTNYSMTADGSNFTRWNVAPSSTTAFGAVGWLNVTYGGEYRVNMTNNISITVISPTLVICNATANQSIANFTFFDETTNESIINGTTIDATFWLWNEDRTVNTTFSANWTNVTYVELCVYPNWANGWLDSHQDYYSGDGSSAPQRSYFFLNQSVSNSTTLNITLYLLNTTSGAKLTRFFVKDTDGSALENAFIYANRYYPEANIYQLVAMAQTDSQGYALSYLQPNAPWFVFDVTNAYGVSYREFEKQQIFCDAALAYCSITLSLLAGGYANFTTLWGGISYRILPWSTLSFSTFYEFNMTASENDLEFSGWFVRYGNLTLINSTNYTTPSGSYQSLNITLGATENLTISAFFKRLGYPTSWIYRTYTHANATLQNSTMTGAVEYLKLSSASATGIGLIALLILVLVMAWVVRLGGPAGAGVIALIVLALFTFFGFVTWQIFALTAIAAVAVMYLNRGY